VGAKYHFMVEEDSGIKSRDQIKRIALDEVKSWIGINNVKIESIKKILEGDDEHPYWEVNGKYEWNESLTGSFTLFISDVGNILTRMSSAYPVPEGKTAPIGQRGHTLNKRRKEILAYLEKAMVPIYRGIEKKKLITKFSIKWRCSRVYIIACVDELLESGEILQKNSRVHHKIYGDNWE